MTSLRISRFAARPESPVVLRYGAAVFLVVAALGTALMLRHDNLPHPFTSFSFAAIAITFWYGGTGPGLLALLLSYLALSDIFIPVMLGDPTSESYIVIYGIFGLLVSRFSASRRRAERLLTAARDNLELRIAERTGELTGANEQLQSTQAELRGEKDRLKLLLQLTNDVVSNLEIRDVLKAVIPNVHHIMRSDFAAVGLPDYDSGRLRAYALGLSSDGHFRESELAPAEETLPFRVLRSGKL